ncbi:MAG: hypothetical protein AAGA55_09235, partial [Planctomycetota bacterium]
MSQTLGHRASAELLFLIVGLSQLITLFVIERVDRGAGDERRRHGDHRLIIGINQIVSKEGSSRHPLTGSGSTLTIGQIIDEQIMVAHVGDSALYHLRKNKMTKLTIDHTMEQEVIDRLGESARASIPPEYPHTLTRCVGQEHELIVDKTRIQLSTGDRLLFCTDGLNKVLPLAMIQKALNADGSPE